MNLDLFTSFKGRANRKPFWLGMLVLSIISTILWMILGGVFGLSAMNEFDVSANASPEAIDAAGRAMFAKILPALGILLLATLWPTLAIYTKRWHDRDKSGWWSLIILIPIIGGIWILIELGFLRGTDGPNRFGSDPIPD
jgi:uncharacterized membrane protein YhaH (DUF805 family)